MRLHWLSWEKHRVDLGIAGDCTSNSSLPSKCTTNVSRGDIGSAFAWKTGIASLIPSYIYPNQARWFFFQSSGVARKSKYYVLIILLLHLVLYLLLSSEQTWQVLLDKCAYKRSKALKMLNAYNLCIFTWIIFMELNVANFVNVAMRRLVLLSLSGCHWPRGWCENCSAKAVWPLLQPDQASCMADNCWWCTTQLCRWAGSWGSHCPKHCTGTQYHVGTPFPWDSSWAW